MKEFRIARCLDYRVEVPVIRKYAIFKDGTPRCIIETDDEGREYFQVPNWIQNDPKMDNFNHCKSIRKYMKYSFSKKPKDMIESIRKGYGDVICRGIFGIEYVLYFLDREYGESLRKKTLEGWRGAKFAYGLFCDSIPVNIHGKLEYNEKDIYFENVNDAITLANSIAKDAYQKAFSLAGLPWKDDAEYLSFLGDTKNPLKRIIFNLLEDVYGEGEILIFRDDASLEKAISLFTIKQVVVKEDK